MFHIFLYKMADFSFNYKSLIFMWLLYLKIYFINTIEK